MQISSLLRVSFVGALCFSPDLARPVLFAQNSTDAEIHEKALEVLRQQTGSSGSTATSVNPSASTETPEQLQERARQILKEQQTSVSQNSATPGLSSQVASDYSQGEAPTPSTAEIHEKALQVLRQQSVPTQPLDRRTREILTDQNREIARQAEKPRFAPETQGLSPEAETRAREVLRQQQHALGYTPPGSLAAPSTELRPVEEVSPSSAPMSSKAVAQPQTSVATTPATPAISSSPATATAINATASTPASSSQYSRELEDRAREIIQKRSQPPSATTVSSPSAWETSPLPPATSARPASTPVQTAPTTAAIHRQAMEILNPAPGEVSSVPSGPKSKKDRLRDLTDLYRADKMTPAEYHQQRAAILAEP